MKNLIMFSSRLVFTAYAWTQGCVAIRNVGGVSPDLLFENIERGVKLIFNVTNRYFEASSAFRGDNFITDTLVTNKIYTLNISVLRLLNNGWSIGLSMPVSANSRNNGADHNGPGLSRDIRHVHLAWAISGLLSISGS